MSGSAVEPSLELRALQLSPPSRAAATLLSLLKVPYKYIKVDVLGGGTRTPEYLRMNPQHTVPVLKHGDFILSESRAILIYLCEEFPGGDKYYPSESKKRALVHQRMYFDMGILYRRLGDAVYPVCFGQKAFIPQENKESLDEAMQWLEDVLEASTFVAGEEMTVADLTVLSTVSTYQACEKAFPAVSQYPNIAKWFNQMKDLIPEYAEVNEKGCNEYRTWFESMYHPESEQKAKLVPQMTLG